MAIASWSLTFPILYFSNADSSPISISQYFSIVPPMVVTDQNSSTLNIAHAHDPAHFPATSPHAVLSNDVFTGEDLSEEFIYLGEDALDEEHNEVWHTGGTASDPEAEGGRDRYVGGRKKKVRWELDEEQTRHSRRESSGIHHPVVVVVPRRRRSRSLSGDELFNFRAPSNRSTGSSLSKGTDHQRQPRPAPPVILQHLPTLDGGGWQEKPFSLDSGIPIIIQRPVSEDSQPMDGPLELSNHHHVGVLTASPRSFRTLSASDDDHEGLKSLSPPAAPDSGPALPSSTLTAPTEDLPTAPNSPSFPPLPTPAPSSAMVPKFTPPNFVQSPKPATTRTISRDRSIDLTSSSSRMGVHFDSNNKPASDTVYKSTSQSSSSRFSRQSSSLLTQRSFNRRQQLLAGASGTHFSTSTKPSPPKISSSTASPRSPIGHVSPRTPQSSMISPAPLPSITIAEEGDFRPESPPWQTVGSGIVTSPRMKGTPSSTNWRTEVINNSTTMNLIKSPPVTPFTSVHLRIDELPNETDSDHESIHHPSAASAPLAPSPSPSAAPLPLPLPMTSLIVPITPDSSISQPSPRPAILSPSPPRRMGITPPQTPPMNPDELPLSSEMVDEALAAAYMPWPTKQKEAAGILPVRKIVKRAERGEWDEGVMVNDIPRQSALWRLVRAQRLWLRGTQELFRLKHPSGLPRDHKHPKTQYVDDGEPLRAVETLVQSILLDPRVVAFKSAEARKDFMEQLAWQIHADSRHSEWPELANLEVDLDEIFATAETRAHGRGVINTRRALASFIRNYVVIAILQEQDGITQAAIQKYGKALDTIDWVNATLGPGPEKSLYGRGDAKERIETVFNGVFGRGVQIRLGHTIIAQYTWIKRNARYSLLRNDLLAELLQGSINLFESISTLVMSPYTHKDLKLDAYVSDYVYHIAHAFFFQGFYARENGKIILDMGHSSPRGGRPAAEVAKERSAASAHAFIQAALLFPEDEETRIECFEMALEEILKVGGIRVGEALAMYKDLRKARIITDSLWNRVAVDDDEEGEDTTIGLFDDDATVAAKKKKKKKKKKKDVVDAAESQPPVAAEPKTTATPSALVQPMPLPPTISPTAAPTPVDPKTQVADPAPWTSPLHSFRTALIDSWLGALKRNQEEKRIMGGDLLHPAKNLRGRPEVVWKDVFDDGGVGEEDDDIGSVPWASWGMRSVKATKWEDLMKEDGPPKGKKTSKGKANTTRDASVKQPQKLPSTTTPANRSPTKTPGPVRRSLEQASLEEITSEVSAAIVAIEADAETSPGKPDRQPKPAGLLWERPSPWSMVQRISKRELFAIDMDAFDGDGAKSSVSTT